MRQQNFNPGDSVCRVLRYVPPCDGQPRLAWKTIIRPKVPARNREYQALAIFVEPPKPNVL